MNDIFNNLQTQIDQINYLKSIYNTLTPQEKAQLELMLEELSIFGESKTYKDLLQIDFDIEPPSIHDFIYSQYYLGKVLRPLEQDPKAPVGLYDFYEEHFTNIFKPGNSYIEIQITGGIGMGKTVAALIIIAYDLCRLLCMKNPRRYFGLLNIKDIVFLLFNLNLDNAYDVVLRPFYDLIRVSPFFQERCSFSERSDYIKFPNGISVDAGSRVQHGIGRDIFSFVLDEANFGTNPSDREKSQMARIYRSQISRLESRFLKPGSSEVWGHAILVSSKNEKSDFLEIRIEEAKQQNANRISRGLKPTTYLIEAPVYRVKSSIAGIPTNLFSKETFRVFVGNEVYPPRILAKDEVVDPELLPYVFDDVPLNLYDAFEADIYTAIKEKLGVSYIPSGIFLKNKTAVLKAAKDYPSLFLRDEIVLDFYDSSDTLTKYANKDYFTKANRNFPRFIHLDAAVADGGDRFGFAMGHVNKLFKVKDLDLSNNPVETIEPGVFIDFVVGIRAKPSQQIPFYKIVDFIKNVLIEFNIQLITSDSYQSVALLQPLKLAGFKTKILSVDATKYPYYSLRTSIYSGRIEYPNNELLKRELLGLVENPKKIDHSPLGVNSKDLADAICGVNYSIIENIQSIIDTSSYLPPIHSANIKDNSITSTTDEIEFVNSLINPRKFEDMADSYKVDFEP